MEAPATTPENLHVVSANCVYKIGQTGDWELVPDLTDEEDESQFRPAGAYYSIDALERESLKSQRPIRNGTLAWGTQKDGHEICDLQMWWRPSKYTMHQLDYDSIDDCRDELMGWYSLPTVGEIREMASDSVALSPIEEPCEPDAPDSWLRLLGYI